jgi:hypothetical protein
MKYIALSLVLTILVACSGGESSAPRNIDDACRMKAERPSWFKTLSRAEQKWGVPQAVFLAAIYQESKFVAKARTPHQYALGIIPMGRQSSAYGYAQAIDSTWDWYRKETGHRFAKRDRFEDAVDFMGWYMQQTEDRNRVSKSDAYNQYLAYHEGHTGYSRQNYRHKSWLINVARSVQDRAVLYDMQLSYCRR